MYLLIDFGGTGIKISKYSHKTIGRIERVANADALREMNVASFASLIKTVAADETLDGIAISAAGFVDEKTGILIKSGCAPNLEGNLVKNLKSYFPRTRVIMINDGEAHARALLYPGRNVRFGAIHLAFGTSVSFGVINEKRQIVHACNGLNWDLGDVQLEYDSKEEWNAVWNKLGRQGYESLCNEVSDPDYEFGLRVGIFLRNLAAIFRPRTIGLSGGRVAAAPAEIMRGIRERYDDPVCLEKVDFLILSEKSAMEGLSTLI